MNPAPTDIKEHVVCSKRCTLHKNTGDGIHRNFLFYKWVLINVIINATGSDILWKCTACLLELSWISYSCPRLSFSLNFHSEILSFYTFPVKNSKKNILYFFRALPCKITWFYFIYSLAQSLLRKMSRKSDSLMQSQESPVSDLTFEKVPAGQQRIEEKSSTTFAAREKCKKDNK